MAEMREMVTFTYSCGCEYNMLKTSTSPESKALSYECSIKCMPPLDWSEISGNGDIAPYDYASAGFNRNDA